MVLLVLRPGCEAFTVKVDDGIELHGEACLPNDGEPGGWPTAVFVHGSGRVARDEFRFHARALAAQGVAAAIYDKRGAGASGGNTYVGGYERYASDIAAVVSHVRAQPYSREDAVGLVGFSEAEWTMPLAAARVEPAFIVIIGASALTPHEQVGEEISIRLAQGGFDAVAQQSARDLHESFGNYLRGDLEAEVFRKKLDSAKSRDWYRVAEDFPEAVYAREEYAWWRGVMDTNVAGQWAGYDGPVLFLKGGADDRSRAGDAAKRFLDMRSGKPSVVRVFPDADHALLEWPFGNRVPPPVFPDGYPQLVAQWILLETSKENR